LGPALPAPYRIVGVVEDIRAQGPDPRPVPEVYAFFAHEPVPHMIVIIRTDATPAAMSAALRRVVSSLDPGQPVTDVRALDTVLAQSAARPKFFLMILGAFALIAVLLAVIGLFGMMIMIVRQRMREIAVRMALVASWLPARAASRVNPVVVLRME